MIGVFRKKIPLKSGGDIDKIREAGEILASVFRSVDALSLAGLSTLELDSLIEGYIRKHRAKPAFRTVWRYGYSSCISINHEVIHGIPSKKSIMRQGDLVKVDVGVVAAGFFADACRTYCIGEVADDCRRLVATAREALELGIAGLVPGKRLGDLGDGIEAFVRSRGMSVVREFSGHGVGFALHEPPLVPHWGVPGTGEEIVPGMVLALEPIVNRGGGGVVRCDNRWTYVTADGGLSAQFEDTVAVTEAGPLVLTQ